MTAAPPVSRAQIKFGDIVETIKLPKTCKQVRDLYGASRVKIDDEVLDDEDKLEDGKLYQAVPGFERSRSEGLPVQSGQDATLATLVGLLKTLIQRQGGEYTAAEVIHLNKSLLRFRNESDATVRRVQRIVGTHKPHGGMYLANAHVPEFGLPPSLTRNPVKLRYVPREPPPKRLRTAEISDDPAGAAAPAPR